MPASNFEIQQILTAVAAGAISTEEAAARLGRLHQSETIINDDESLRLDVDRQSRCGFPEVVYAPGKSNEQLLAAFQALSDNGQNCLATRCEPEQAACLTEHFPDAIHHSEARTVRINVSRPKSGRVAVITAGTSDRPVAAEALETLHWMNIDAELIVDVGVAGPQRFLQVKHKLADCGAVVVVAGMEGALPSMVAGWLSCPVIAVPTSVGYGAAFGGVAALLSMLNSCAANVAVVNIDAGFKGGFLAGIIAARPS